MQKISIVYDPIFLKHLTGPLHPESPARLLSILEMLEKSSLNKKLNFLEPRKASQEEILLVHSDQLYQQLKKTQFLNQSFLDADTLASKASFEAACLATGSVLVGIESLLSAQSDQVFVLPRPPGHHAEKEKAMGFCLFNHVAIGAEFLIQQKKFKRVAIFDFDVHHGNGTQHIFEERLDVLYLSTHQYPFYPGTGAASEKGKGKGEGYTLNFPLESGSGNSEYHPIFMNQVLPSLIDYQPEFIFISAGFDAHALDPLGALNLSSEYYGEMARHLSLLRKKLNVPMLWLLEGGYHLKALAQSVQLTLEGILKVK